MSIQNYVLVLAFMVTLFGLSGCGGSSGGEEELGSSGLENISITGFALGASEYNEHETVTLSLNTEGDDGSLTYDWRVTYSGGTVDFSGQNTDTITFVAPEVDNFELISIHVYLDLENGHLSGNTHQFTSIKVNDSDTVSANSLGIITPGLTTDLPEVSALDMSLINEGGTWLSNNYYNLPTSLYGFSFEGEVYQATQEITYFDLDLLNKVGFRSCGSDEIKPLVDEDHFSCSGELDINFYQNANSFRVEEVCDNKVQFATNFSKLRDNQSASFGTASLSFESSPEPLTTSNVCGRVSEFVLVIHDDENGDGLPDNDVTSITYAELSTDIEGESLVIKATIDDIKSYWTYFIGSVLDPDGINNIEFDSGALANLQDQDAESGNLSVERSEHGIEVEIDAEIRGNNGQLEDIEGTFTLSFE